MNIDYLLNLYKKTYPGDALWMLVQDMNRQAFVWYNVAERIKCSKPGEISGLKEWFEDQLMALPKDSLTNPTWWLDLDKAFERMRNYSKALLKIARSYSLEPLAELNVEVGVAAIVEVQLGLPPALTIGFERSASVAGSFGASASNR